MGKEWDNAVPGVTFWREVLRILKPGAFVLAFSSTRTYHRLVCAMEDAGFEIRDMLAWIYSQGWPKGLNLSKAMDEDAGVERPIVGTKLPPPDSDWWAKGFTPEAAIKFHAQGLENSKNVYGAGLRVGHGAPLTAAVTDDAKRWEGYDVALKPALEPLVLARKPCDGRIIDSVRRHGCGSLAVDACRIGTSKEVPASVSTHAVADVSGFGLGAGSADQPGRNPTIGRYPSNVVFDEQAARELDERKHRASRFFYVAKAARKEREAGCQHLPKHVFDDGEEASTNPHPTLKPLSLNTPLADLLQYLSRLLLPPLCEPGNPPRLFVPFSGAGSEVIGALRAGWRHVEGIEQDDSYLRIAQARVRHWCPETKIARDGEDTATLPLHGQMSLWDR